jgi:hypothetical protein
MDRPPAPIASEAYDPRLCENVERYDCTRNFEACGQVQSKKMQKLVFCSALGPNQISFSHSQDPQETSLHRSKLPTPLIHLVGAAQKNGTRFWPDAIFA